MTVMLRIGTVASSPEGRRGVESLSRLFADLPSDEELSVTQRRDWLEDYMRKSSSRFPVTRSTIAGVAVELHPGSTGAKAGGALLYAHGGAYVVGSAAVNRELASAIGAAAGAALVSADYRLAPEHPFPAGRDDLVALYSELSRSYRAIALIGDSAGGGLVISAACAIRDAGLRPPVALGCMSPWSDLELAGASCGAHARLDRILNLAQLHADARLYAGEAGLHRASPINCDLSQLPPILIQVGSAELLLDDARNLGGRLAAADNAVTLEIWEDMTHGWQLFRDVLPEADQAIDRLGQFLRSQLDLGLSA